MIGLLWLFLALMTAQFKSKSRLEAENAALRHQLMVLRRKVQGRVRLTNNDRWFLIQLYRWFPSILHVVNIVRPETLVRWHRTGFRWYWRWKSRPRGGRPKIETELRALIRQMSIENPLWRAPRIHGELLKSAQPLQTGQRIDPIHSILRRVRASSIARMLISCPDRAIAYAARLWFRCRRQDSLRNIVPCLALSPTPWHRLGVPS